MGTFVHPLIANLQPPDWLGEEGKDNTKNFNFSLISKAVQYLYLSSYIINVLMSQSALEQGRELQEYSPDM